MFLKLKILILFLFLIIAIPVEAAVLSLATQQPEYGLGDTFILSVLIDPTEDCINTVAATIEFDTVALDFIDFLTGESLISIWLESPSKADFESINETGKINFAGGVPGGYCGKIPGDPGDSNIIAQIIFRTSAFTDVVLPDNFQISINKNAQIFINDGAGTKDAVEIENINLKLNPELTIDREEASQLISLDKIPPEPFVVELHQKDDIYNGQYFIIFSTTDKQTGIDHYEVYEYAPEDSSKSIWKKFADLFFPKQESDWKIAATPYLLKDQKLNSVIKVKAIDKAGNERFVEYIPPEPARLQDAKYVYFYLIVFMLLLFIGIVSLMVFRSVRRRHTV